MVILFGPEFFFSRKRNDIAFFCCWFGLLIKHFARLSMELYDNVCVTLIIRVWCIRLSPFSAEYAIFGISCATVLIRQTWSQPVGHISGSPQWKNSVQLIIEPTWNRSNSTGFSCGCAWSEIRLLTWCCGICFLLSFDFFWPYACYLYVTDTCQRVAISHACLLLLVSFTCVGCSCATCEILTYRHFHLDQLVRETTMVFKNYTSMILCLLQTV